MSERNGEVHCGFRCDDVFLRFLGFLKGGGGGEVVGDGGEGWDWGG